MLFRLGGEAEHLRHKFTVSVGLLLAGCTRIGLAVADDLAGPWRPIGDPFTVRERLWDNWHLSTGPILAR